MSNLAIRLTPEPIRSLAYTSIGAGYMGIGTALSNPSRILLIQNLTDVQLLFSFDGINDHIMLPSDGFLLLDVTANKTNNGGASYIGEGVRIYVKEVGTPSMGGVYVSSFYGIDG